MDQLERIGMNPEHSKEIANNIEYRNLLDEEFNQVLFDQTRLRHEIFKGASNPEI